MITDTPLSLKVSGALAEDFSESDLPWKVDVVDWATTSETFRRIIEKDKVVVQRGRRRPNTVGEWRECTVDDLKSSAPNALATGPFGSAISSRFFADRGIPVIRGSNLSQDVGHRLIDDGLVFLSEEKAKEFSRSMARPGDLIFTCWGTIDQVGLVDGRSRFATYVVSNKQMKFTPDPQRADSLFLDDLFSNPEMRTAIRDQGIGSSVPGFNLGQLRSIRVRMPPLTEQRAIAHILGTLDDKIELNRRMNKTLEAMARARLFDVSSGKCRCEQFGDGCPDQVDDAREGCRTAITPGSGPGGLEQAIERFEPRVGIA